VVKPLCRASVAASMMLAGVSKIRLPDFEMDDVAALCLQRSRLDQYFESGLVRDAPCALARRTSEVLVITAPAFEIKTVSLLTIYDSPITPRPSSDLSLLHVPQP